MAKSDSPPVPSLRSVPDPIAIGSTTMTSPAPSNLTFLFAAVIASPEATLKVSCPASLWILELASRVTRPAMVLLPEVLRSAPFEPTPSPLRLIGSATSMSPATESVPPDVTDVPPAVEPSALAWLAAMVPPEAIVVAPVKSLLPLRVRVPAPTLARVPAPVSDPE